MTKIRTNYIHKDTLIRIYKKLKSFPNKVFLAKDFSINFNKVRQTYLDVLRKLGLAKEVKVIYFCGIKKNVKHETIGYKSKNEKL